MIDIKLIREQEKEVRKNLSRRKDNNLLKQFDAVVQQDKDYRKILLQVEQLRHTRNQKTLDINKQKKAGKDFKSIITEVQQLNKKLGQQEGKLKSLQQALRANLLGLPNLMHDSVPYGKDDKDNVEVRKRGRAKKPTFKLKNHGQLAEDLGVADFERSAKVAGAGFYYMYGDLVLLNQALHRFAMDTLIKKGFTPVEPPYMMRKKPYEGVTDLQDFEDVLYKIENEDEYLIATSEHPLVAMFMNETLPEDKLPLKFVGLSMNFRKEIGSHGIDEKGFFRMHQFLKVEQVVFSTPEQSWKLHEELIKNAEFFFKELGLAYNIVNICTGDLGIVAAKKYDLQAWMPRTEEYKEVVSCSNCTDYQSRRLNIRCINKKGEKRVLHTLNGTAVATSRALVAILENYQNKDGTVTIPAVLQKYMGRKKKIVPQPFF